MKVFMELEKYMLPCLSKKFFGVECLGCGFQRALVLFLKGEFVEAFNMYPALYPLLLLGFVYVLSFLNKGRDYRVLFWIFGVFGFLFAVINYVYRHF